MWLGLAVIVISECMLIFKIEPVYTHFTLVVWWGYILFLDGAIKRRRGVSFLADRPLFFIYMAVLSVFWWLVFEFYNCYLENWVYIGLPDNIVHRYCCYILAYATITPAILTTFEAALTFWPPAVDLDLHRRPQSKTLWCWFITGALCITVPLFVPVREIRHYLFAFVWVGFVFFIEPLACWSKNYSLLRWWAAGGRSLVWNMFGAGAVCGLLWEFWNYWAGSKWLYTVPIFPTIRYFEMPVLGFLGFLPFAWECIVLTVLTTLVIGSVRINPHCALPAFAGKWTARVLFISLFAVLYLAYSIHDYKYFPWTRFNFTLPASANSVDNEAADMEKFLDSLLEMGTRDDTLTVDAFPRRWSPESATRDNLARLGRLQRHPDSRIREFSDRTLRAYAVSARFNWANLREE